MNMNVANLLISSDSCNELNSFNLNEYRYLKSIEIGSDCFMNVDIFNIDGLNHLKSLKIGNDSFTQHRDRNNQSRSFSILNCTELESIEIGHHSFSDYGGGFELKNLPKLSTIKIGSIKTDYSDSSDVKRSTSFSCLSFVIRGIIEVIIANE